MTKEVRHHTFHSTAKHFFKKVFCITEISYFFFASGFDYEASTRRDKTKQICAVNSLTEICIGINAVSEPNKC